MPSLPDREWKSLVRMIQAKQVIPVIGPELVRVRVEGQADEVCLNRHLAPLLAAQLGLENPETFSTVNQTAGAHLLRGGKRAGIYDELRELLEAPGLSPGTTLRDLAGIGGFDLFLSSTFDPFLAQALAAVRPGFRAERDVLRFHPSNPTDLPDALPGSSARLLHLLGDFNTYPDFAVWEEDHMEFVCGLIEKRDNLRRLFDLLKSRHLLLLGAPASDWIFRFLLRIARQERLTGRSEDAAGEYLADDVADLEPPLVFFFDKLVATTRVLDGSPARFVAELAERWKDHAKSPADDQAFLDRIPDVMPKDSVFLSYAREDLSSALAFARGLHEAGVPVWLDKARLQAGVNYESTLRDAIQIHASYFLSLVSATTEADAGRQRYFHKERDWAAEHPKDGYVWYIPVELRDSGRPANEPAAFAKIHSERLPGGRPTPAFLTHLRSLWDTFRVSGRPKW